MTLTRIKAHFTDHNPGVLKVQLELDELGNIVMQIDGNVTRVLQNLVGHVGVGDSLAPVERSSDAEENASLCKYLGAGVEGSFELFVV